MPIYAYKCESCGHAKDVLQKMSDALLTVCPQCDASTFKKQLTSAGFQLKGSGWYVTDFRGGAGAGPGAESSAADNSNKSGETTATPAVASGAAASATATSASVPASTPSAPAASSTATPVKGSA